MRGYAKRLQRFCEREIYDIRVCVECYRNSNEKADWFENACDRPHLLVWAKIKGSPFWPAKAVTMRKNLVDVRFFGDTMLSLVPVENVRLFSKVSPNGTMSQSNTKKMEACLRVRKTFFHFEFYSEISLIQFSHFQSLGGEATYK